MRSLATLALTAALAAGLAACGEEQSASPRPEASGSSAPETAAPQHEVLGIVSGVADGPAQVTTRPTYVGDRLALLRYVDRLGSEDLAAEVQDLVLDHEPGEGMVEAAVLVANGCDVPPGVSVREAPGGGFEVLPRKVAEPSQECLVAHTSVAVLELPEDGFPDRGSIVPAD